MRNMEVITKLVILLFIGFSQPITEAFHVSLSHHPSGKVAVNLQKSSVGNVPHPDFTPLFHHPHIPTNSLIEPIATNGKNLMKNEHPQEIDSFTKHVLSSIAQRTSYANSPDEIKHWKEGTFGEIGKRTGQNEQHTGGCIAKKDWIELDSNHYPRFLKTYNCTSRNCDMNRNFGECRAKIYSVKVLKRKSSEQQHSDEECDQNLPEELRCNWKLKAVNITTYCECVSAGLSAFGRR